jgi:hypothetical protein
MADTTQWEYRAISAGSFWNEPKDEDLESLLNELGEDGWEVVSVFTRYGANKVRIVAKRPLTGSVRRRRTWPG